MNEDVLNQTLVQETLTYFTGLPFLELIAVFAALIYVILAAKGNIWCWPAAFISTVLYTVLFYDVYLWMDSLLQLYYMGMAVYGWLCWRNVHSYSAVRVVDAEDLPSAAKITRDKCTSPNIQTWSLTAHLKIIIALSVLSFGLGSFMAHFTPADFPYFDATTTVFAVFATYMVTKKVLENWLYWVVIDFLSIYIYIEKGLTPTAVLFALYVILALYGYIKWQQTYRQQQTVSYA